MLFSSFLEIPIRARRDPSRRRTVQLSVEQLEDRCLFAVANIAAQALPAAGEFGLGDGHWQQIVAQTQDPQHAQILFLGDSITAQYRTIGEASWNRYIQPLQADDFGIGGITTSQVLRQLELGQLRAVSPHVVVLEIGTNNLASGQTPHEVVDGIQAILQEIQAQAPMAQVLLIGILPRGLSLADPIRQLIPQTNELLAQLDNGRDVKFLDFGSDFLQADGTVSHQLTLDYVHPSDVGYEVYTAAIYPLLLNLLQEAQTTTADAAPKAVHESAVPRSTEGEEVIAALQSATPTMVQTTLATAVPSLNSVTNDPTASGAPVTTSPKGVQPGGAAADPEKKDELGLDAPQSSGTSMGEDDQAAASATEASSTEGNAPALSRE